MLYLSCCTCCNRFLAYSVPSAEENASISACVYTECRWILLRRSVERAMLNMCVKCRNVTLSLFLQPFMYNLTQCSKCVLCDHLRYTLLFHKHIQSRFLMTNSTQLMFLLLMNTFHTTFDNFHFVYLFSTGKITCLTITSLVIHKFLKIQ